jgi:hypothetical protein
VVQGEGRFLALGVSGCFGGNESCIIKYKVEWRTKASPEGLLYTREAGESESIGVCQKGKARAWGSGKWVYMVKLLGQTVQTGCQNAYIS